MNGGIVSLCLSTRRVTSRGAGTKGLKSMSHVMKIWERVIEGRLYKRGNFEGKNSLDLCQAEGLRIPLPHSDR